MPKLNGEDSKSRTSCRYDVPLRKTCCSNWGSVPNQRSLEKGTQNKDRSLTCDKPFFQSQTLNLTVPHPEHPPPDALAKVENSESDTRSTDGESEGSSPATNSRGPGGAFPLNPAEGTRILES